MISYYDDDKHSGRNWAKHLRFQGSFEESQRAYRRLQREREEREGRERERELDRFSTDKHSPLLLPFAFSPFGAS